MTEPMTDERLQLPNRLLDQATWLESCSFAVLRGDLLREAAAEIDALRAELASRPSGEPAAYIRQNCDGATVMAHQPNSGPNCECKMPCVFHGLEIAFIDGNVMTREQAEQAAAAWVKQESE